MWMREKLETLLEIETQRCLPHEEEACGADYAHHVLSFCGAIKAYGEWSIQHAIEQDPERGRELADGLYEYHLLVALDRAAPHTQQESG